MNVMETPLHVEPRESRWLPRLLRSVRATQVVTDPVQVQERYAYYRPRIQLSSAGWMVASFEVAGLAGMLVTGWLTDRLFKGRAAPVSLICMLLCGGTLFVFYKASGQIVWLNTILLMAAGFFIYGPQALVAVIVANLATKRAAATAVGLTSLFGYASTVLSGWGIGMLVQHYGWGFTFGCLVLVALVGASLFAAALPARAHGYADDPNFQSR